MPLKLHKPNLSHGRNVVVIIILLASEVVENFTQHQNAHFASLKIKLIKVKELTQGITTTN